MHVLFQPHRYTRTLHLLDDFARAFHQADRVVVLDIYAASEKPHRRRDRRKRWWSACASSAIAARVRGVERRRASKRSSAGREAGDMILTLGAGSVSQLGEKILEGLKSNA